MEKTIRLNKFISDSGICSRREADKHIEQGHVIVNGKRAKIGDQISPTDKVLVNGQQIIAKVEEDNVFLAFNKPVGIVSTTEIGAKDNIVDYIGYHERIFPVGRLDKDSQGLIFMTNNGDIVNKILRAGNNHEKEYVVTVDKPITDSFIAKMSSGVPILGTTTKKCKVTKEGANSFRIILVQGLNRQIRRMCEYLEYEVVKLERVRIMNITLKGLPVGEWRELKPNEMEQINAAISESSSTEEASTGKKSASKPGRIETPTKREQIEMESRFSEQITESPIKLPKRVPSKRGTFDHKKSEETTSRSSRPTSRPFTAKESDSPRSSKPRSEGARSTEKGDGASTRPAPKGGKSPFKSGGASARPGARNAAPRTNADRQQDKKSNPNPKSNQLRAGSKTASSGRRKGGRK